MRQGAEEPRLRLADGPACVPFRRPGSLGLGLPPSSGWRSHNQPARESMPAAERAAIRQCKRKYRDTVHGSRAASAGASACPCWASPSEATAVSLPPHPYSSMTQRTRFDSSAGAAAPLALRSRLCGRYPPSTCSTLRRVAAAAAGSCGEADASCRARETPCGVCLRAALKHGCYACEAGLPVGGRSRHLRRV